MDASLKTHNILEEEYKINLGYYNNGSPGFFGYCDGHLPKASEEAKKQSTVLRWQSCREEFAKNCVPYFTGFIYHYDFYRIRNPIPFAEYIYKFENELGVEHISFQRINTEGSKYKYTDDRTILWCNVPDFWKSPMKHSLLTAIFRVATKKPIHITGFEDGLVYDSYTARTIPAIKHFLKGNTFYSGTGNGIDAGWFWAFKDRDSNFFDLTAPAGS